jgi:hypothetical protein
MAEADVKLDTSDVDRWVGKPIVFAEMWDPCNATDIRRWVQAMDYANPLHWDENFARKSKFGGIVAPQSFTVAMDYGHGFAPDLRRRGMVVLRHAGAPRRQAGAGAHFRRLPRVRHRLCRTDDVRRW